MGTDRCGYDDDDDDDDDDDEVWWVRGPECI